jgi:hypothetical protein
VKEKISNVFKAFSAELLLYAVLVILYILLVLHFLGNWLFELFRDERQLYAIVALVLIVGQGYVLEIITRLLLKVIKGKRED